MSVIIRLQGLSWSASAMNIRNFFQGLNIPPGGVRIIGGEKGDAFIAFSTDEDARQAMMMTGNSLNDCPVQLFLSSKTEMQNTIIQAKNTTPVPATTMSPADTPPTNTMPIAQQQMPLPQTTQAYPTPSQGGLPVSGLAPPAALASLNNLHALLPSNITQALGFLANANLNNPASSQPSLNPQSSSQPTQYTGNTNNSGAFESALPGEYSMGGVQANKQGVGNQHNVNNSSIMHQNFPSEGDKFQSHRPYMPQNTYNQSNEQNWGQMPQQQQGRDSFRNENQMPFGQTNSQSAGVFPSAGQNVPSSKPIDYNRFGSQSQSTAVNIGQQGYSKSVDTAVPFGVDKQHGDKFDSTGQDRPFDPRAGVGDRPFAPRMPHGDGQFQPRGPHGDRPFYGMGPRGERPFGPRASPQGERPFAPMGPRGAPMGPQHDRPFQPRGPPGDRPFEARRPNADGGPFGARGPNPGNRPFDQRGPPGDMPFDQRRPQGDRTFDQGGPHGDRPFDGRGPPNRPFDSRGPHGGRPDDTKGSPGGKPFDGPRGQQGDRPNMDFRGPGPRNDRPYDQRRPSDSPQNQRVPPGVNKTPTGENRDAKKDGPGVTPGKDSASGQVTTAVLSNEKDEFGRNKRVGEETDKSKSRDKDSSKRDSRERDRSKRDSPRDRDRRDRDRDSRRRDRDDDRRSSRRDRDRDRDRDRRNRDRDSDRRDSRSKDTDNKDSPASDSVRRSRKRSLSPSNKADEKDKRIPPTGPDGQQDKNAQPPPFNANDHSPTKRLAAGGDRPGQPATSLPTSGAAPLFPVIPPNSLLGNPPPHLAPINPQKQSPNNPAFQNRMPLNSPPLNLERNNQEDMRDSGDRDVSRRARPSRFEDLNPGVTPVANRQPISNEKPPFNRNEPGFNAPPDGNRFGPGYDRQFDNRNFPTDRPRMDNRPFEPPHGFRDGPRPGDRPFEPPQGNRDGPRPGNRPFEPSQDGPRPGDRSFEPPHGNRDGPRPGDRPFEPPYGNRDGPRPGDRPFEAPRGIWDGSRASDRPFEPPHGNRDGPRPGIRPFEPPHGNRDGPRPGDRTFEPPHGNQDGPRPGDRPFEPPHGNRDGPRPGDRPFEPPHGNRDGPRPGDRPFEPPIGNRDGPRPGDRPFEPPHGNRDGPRPGDRPFEPPIGNRGGPRPGERPFEPPHGNRDGPRPGSRPFEPPIGNRDGPRPGERRPALLATPGEDQQNAPLNMGQRPPMGDRMPGQDARGPPHAMRDGQPPFGDRHLQDFRGPPERDSPFTGPDQGMDQGPPFDESRNFRGPPHDVDGRQSMEGSPFNNRNPNFRGPPFPPGQGPDRNRQPNEFPPGQAPDRNRQPYEGRPFDDRRPPFNRGPAGMDERPFDDRFNRDCPPERRFDGPPNFRGRPPMDDEQNQDFDGRGNQDFDDRRNQNFDAQVVDMEIEEDMDDRRNQDFDGRRNQDFDGRRNQEFQGRGGPPPDFQRQPYNRGRGGDFNNRPPPFENRNFNELNRDDRRPGFDGPRQDRHMDDRDQRHGRQDRRDDRRERERRDTSYERRDGSRRDDRRDDRGSRHDSSSKDVESSKRSEDKSTSSSREGSTGATALCSVTLESLPKETNHKDIRQFFSSCEIPKNGVKLINDEEGNRIGKAYVQFSSQADYKTGLAQNRQRIRNTPVVIKPVSGKEYEEAVDSFYPDEEDPAERSKDIGRCNTLTATLQALKNTEQMKNRKNDNTKDYVVKLAMLPSSVTPDGIRQFFSGCEIARKGDAVYIDYDRRRECTGLCFVEFTSDLAYNKALNQRRVYQGTTIRIEAINEKDKNILQSIRKQTEGESKNSSSSQKSEKTDNIPSNKDNVVKITKLPRIATAGGMRQFFSGCEIAKKGDAIYIDYDDKLLCTGLCFVEFSSDSAYNKAMSQRKVYQRVSIDMEAGSMKDIETLQNSRKRRESGNRSSSQKSGDDERSEAKKRDTDSRSKSETKPEDSKSRSPRVDSSREVKSKPAHVTTLGSDYNCLRIENIPEGFRSFDVRCIFEGLGVHINNVQLPHDAVGKFVGEAYVDFMDSSNVEIAMVKNGCMVVNNKVTMTPITKSETIDQLRTFKQSLQLEQPSKQDVFFFVKASNLPTNVTTGELMNFFSGYQPAPESMRLNISDTSQAIGTSTALVGFRIREDAERAVASISLRPMRNRPVQLTKVIL